MKEERSYAYNLEDVMQEKFDYGWDQEQLWELAKNKKVREYKIKDIKHWVYSPCWNKGECFLSIYQVLQQPKKFPEHMKRIKKADLKYPLIVIPDKYDKYGGILDGNHRFGKIILENKREVKFVYFTRKELEKIKINLKN